MKKTLPALWIVGGFVCGFIIAESFSSAPSTEDTPGPQTSVVETKRPEASDPPDHALPEEVPAPEFVERQIPGLIENRFSGSLNRHLISFRTMGPRNE